MEYEVLRGNILKILPNLIGYEDIDECEDSVYLENNDKVYCFIRMVLNYIIDSVHNNSYQLEEIKSFSLLIL